MKVNCIIIEDQLPAQRLLQKYIQQVDNLELLATYTDGLSALPLLHQGAVDVLFLDINLPKISGLNLLRTLNTPPKVIITTAYPEFAVEGFELAVDDYLLKPIAFPRFLKSIGKVTRQAKSSAPLPVTPAEEEETFVFVKSDKVIYRIRFDEVQYVKADGDFVHLVTTTQKYFLAHTLKYWRAILPNSRFLQVHKSYLVDLSKVQSIQGNKIQLADTSIPIGRTYRAALVKQVDKLLLKQP